MNREQINRDDAANLILKQARLVATEVARAEAIVDLAIGVASIAMASIEKASSAETAALARETLNVARVAAAHVLRVAKKEAEGTLILAKLLAERLLDESSP